jgi:hypothetical protein
MGLSPDDLALIHEGHGSKVFRVACAGKSYVLKLGSGHNMAHELACYRILARCRVSTPVVHGHTEAAILIEDFTMSGIWRLADESDADDPATGAAIARWYRAFHDAGYVYLRQAHANEPPLVSEADLLTPEGIVRIGKGLAIQAHRATTGSRPAPDDRLHLKPVWRYAAAHIETIKAAIKLKPRTFNYNDFFMGNLALSIAAPLRAIVFDYHLMGSGLAYSDCRNVASALGPNARAAFQKDYGPTDPEEDLLDQPTAILYGLREALAQPEMPAWAQSCIQQVENGELERSISAALAVAGNILKRKHTRH